eukprot:IDg5779t1
MGDESTSTAVGYGDVVLQIVVDGEHKICKLQHVLHVPAFAYSLISVSKMAKKGIKAIFDQTGVRLILNKLTIAQGYLNHNLYELNTANSHQKNEAAFISNMQLWHERFGHVNNTGIINMARKGIVKGLKLAAKQHNGDILCEGCITGKMARTAIPKASSSRSNEPPGTYPYRYFRVPFPIYGRLQIFLYFHR